MKCKIILFLALFFSISCMSQDIINPYEDYSFSTISNFPENKIVNSISGYHYTPFFSNVNTLYDGEYEIIIDKLDLNWFNYASNAKSYKIETVSFPFTMDCAYFPLGCSGNTLARDLYMPNTVFNLITKKWGDLSLETPFPGLLYSSWHNGISYNETGQSLISAAFNNGATTVGRSQLPHTILKQTLYIHCGGDPFVKDYVDSISWYYDNTRGRMRYYPFFNDNTHNSSSGSNVVHDVLFYPEFIYLKTTNGGQDHPYNFNQQNALLNYNALNYFPYNEIEAQSFCSISQAQKPIYDPNNPAAFTFPAHNCIFPASNMLFSAPLRNFNGTFLAGYEYINDPSGPGTDRAEVNLSQIGIIHNYFIDKGYPDIDLNWINPSEKIIFNPSDVAIGPRIGSSNLVNLIFPSGYSFKTILGVYPSVEEVIAANNDPENGGPFSDLRDVPVPVYAKYFYDLSALQNDPNYPDLRTFDDPNTTVNEEFGNYTIKNHGKITVEECVKIFDANFYIEEGGTLVFNNFPTVLFPSQRSFAIPSGLGGGAILKNYSNIQNLQRTKVIQDYELKYIALNEINAGNYVSSGNDYTIEANNTDVKFEAGQTIRLEPGFTAKEGCKFVATCKPITYSTKICNTPAQPSSSNRFSQTNNSNSSSATASFDKVGENSINLSPNPTTGIFALQVQNINGEFTYEVSDIYGRKVLSNNSKLANTNIDLSEQPHGMYIVSLSANGNQWAKKIIKE